MVGQSGHSWTKAGAPRVLVSRLISGAALIVTASHLAPPSWSCFKSNSASRPILAATSLSHLPWQIHVGQTSSGLSVTSSVGTIEELWGEESNGDSHWCAVGLSSTDSRLPRLKKRTLLEKTFLLKPCLRVCLPWSENFRWKFMFPLERVQVLQLSHGQGWPLVVPHGWLWVNSAKCVSSDLGRQGRKFVGL